MLGLCTFNLSEFAKSTIPTKRILKLTKCPDKDATIEVNIFAKYTNSLDPQVENDKFSDMPSIGSDEMYVAEEEKKLNPTVNIEEKQKILSAGTQPKIMSSYPIKKEANPKDATSSLYSSIKTSDSIKMAGSMVVNEKALGQEVSDFKYKKIIEDKDKTIDNMRSEINNLNSQIKVFQKEQLKEETNLNRRIEELKTQIKELESSKSQSEIEASQYDAIKKRVLL